MEYGNADVATKNEILRTVVGSGVLGLALDGLDDHDEMGIYIESAEHVLGPFQQRDNYIYRTQNEGVRSGPGDTDLVSYELRRYVQLAVKGNPTVLLPLFAPDEFVIKNTYSGIQLRKMRHQFISLESVQRVIGYARAQQERMMGGGNQRKVPNRPELIEKYGWDVKYGSHAYRLAYQALELAKTGALELPMHPWIRERALEIKTGKWSRDDVNEAVSQFIAETDSYVASGQCHLPPTPELKPIYEFLIDAHMEQWEFSQEVHCAYCEC